MVLHSRNTKQMFVSLAATLGLVLCAVSIARAADGVSLERIAIIESKGKSGTLDHLFVDSATARLFLTNQINNTLDVIDLKGNRLLEQVSGQESAHSVVYVAGLDRVFVGCGSGVCNVLEGKSYTPVKSLSAVGADSVRFDARTGRVAVASERSLTLIDGKSLEIVATIKLLGTPKGFQVVKTRPRIYINTQSSTQVAVLDTEKNEVIANYALAGDSKGIGPLAIDEASGRILVGLRANPRLAVLDINTGKEIATAPIPDGADDMFYDPELKRIYVSCSPGFISVIQQVDADHYEVLTDLATVKGAKTSFYDPQLKRLYLAVPRQADKNGPEIWVYQTRP